MIISLIKEKKNIEVCSENGIPRSFQYRDVVSAGIFMGKKRLSGFSEEQKESLEKWKKVFANRIALGLSFRKTNPKFSSDFLCKSSDFDCDALELLVDLCRKSVPFRRSLCEALVSSV